MRMLILFVAVAVMAEMTGCAARYPADAANPPTNTFGPHAGTPDIAPADYHTAPTKAHLGA